MHTARLLGEPQIGANSRPWRLLVAAFGANSIAYAGWYVQPEQLHELDVVQGLGQTAASWIVSAEITTAALISLVLGNLIASRAPRLVLAIGASVVLLGHSYALVAGDYGALLLSRLVAGIGEGLLWITLNAAIAGLDKPHRRYGQVNAATAIFLAVLVAIVPYADELHLRRGVFVALLCAVAILTPTLVPFLFGKRDAIDPRVPIATGFARGWILVGAVALWNMVVTITYALSGVIGSRTNSPTFQVDLAIAISLVGVIGGASATAWVGLRFGRIRTLGILAALEVISAFANIYWTTLPGFAISLLVVNFALYSMFAYLLGLAAELDPSGGTSAALAGGFALGGGMSPLFGSYLIAWTRGYGSVAWMIVLGCVVVFAVARRLDASLHR
jgi:predicted MFS family arabinose efflux permease